MASRTTTANGMKICYDSDQIMEYAICPAREGLNIHTERVADKHLVTTRKRKALNEVAISMLGGTMPKQPEKLVETVTDKIFEDLDYKKKNIDMKATRDLLLNFVYMMPEKELIVKSLTKKIKIKYNKITVNSRIDLITYYQKRGQKLPTIIDFSNTIYEQFYNPIVYQCQVVLDFMDLKNTNTEIMILSLSSGKRWYYDKNTYGDLLYKSMCQFLEDLKNKRFPLRVGWWCAGCQWRGICRHMVNTNK